MKKALEMIGAIALGLTIVAAVFAASVTAPTVTLSKVSPSGGMEMRDIIITDLQTIATAVGTAQSDATGADKAEVLAAPAIATATAAGTAAKVVTIKMQGISGADITGRHLIRVWTSETAFGAPSTNNITSLVLSTGSAIQQVVEHADYIYLTAAGGTATATVTMTAAGTNYVQVAAGGKVGSLAIVTTE